MAGERTQIAVRLRPDLVARLDAEARDRMLSRNVLVERAVEELLASIEAGDHG